MRAFQFGLAMARSAYCTIAVLLCVFAALASAQPETYDPCVAGYNFNGVLYHVDKLKGLYVLKEIVSLKSNSLAFLGPFKWTFLRRLHTPTSAP